MNETTTTTATARRIIVKGKTVIETTLPNGTVRLDGGKIAERATAVILVRWDTDWSLNAHRSDFAKAQAEAAAFLKPPRRGAVRNIAAEVLVVPVVD